MGCTDRRLSRNARRSGITPVIRSERGTQTETCLINDPDSRIESSISLPCNPPGE
jgi:hypothetical protein